MHHPKEQNSTYHSLCYTSRGALAGTRYSLHVTRIIRLNYHCTKFKVTISRRKDGNGLFNNSFSFQPVLHDWCNKGCGMCYPVYGMVHIKELLLLIGKSSPYGGSRFPLSLSEWSFTIIMSDAI